VHPEVEHLSILSDLKVKRCKSHDIKSQKRKTGIQCFKVSNHQVAAKNAPTEHKEKVADNKA